MGRCTLSPPRPYRLNQSFNAMSVALGGCVNKSGSVRACHGTHLRTGEDMASGVATPSALILCCMVGEGLCGPSGESVSGV